MLEDFNRDSYVVNQGKQQSIEDFDKERLEILNKVKEVIENFFICHKIPDIDRVYWFRRVEELRKIYSERQQYLNPINGKKPIFDPKQMEDIINKIKNIDEKIDSFIKDDDLKNLVKEILTKELKTDTMQNQFESKIVKTEKELIELSNQGYECQQVGNNKWLMRRKISNITFNVQ